MNEKEILGIVDRLIEREKELFYRGVTEKNQEWIVTHNAKSIILLELKRLITEPLPHKDWY